MNSNRSTNPRRTATALVVAVVYLVGLVGTALHSIHADHVRCAEHGELVHVHGDDHHADESHADEHAVEEHRAQNELHAGSTPLEEHSHGHCVDILIRDDEDDDPDAAGPEVHLREQRIGTAFMSVVSERGPPLSATSTAILMLAPKTGPPGVIAT